MRTIGTCLCVLAVAPAANAGMTITEVLAKSINLQPTMDGDWFEITNLGDASVLLKDWGWKDDKDLSAHPILSFPSISLDPHESLICLSEPSADDWRTDWAVDDTLTILTLADFGNFYGLGKSGDSIELYDDGGNLVTSFSWTDSTPGFSLDAYHGGLSSVSGVNGAWTANGGDVGSPGVAIPEPLTLTLLVFGLAIITVKRGPHALLPRHSPHHEGRFRTW